MSAALLPEPASRPGPLGLALGHVRGYLRSLSLRTRVGLLVAVGVGLAVALTSVAAYVTVSNQLHLQRDQALLARARAAASGVLADPTIIANLPPGAFGAVDIRIGLLASSGSGLRGPNSESPPYDDVELAVARRQLPQALFTGRVDGMTFRVVAVPTSAGGALVLAQSTAEIEKTLDRLGIVLLLVGGIGVAVAASAGVAIARAGLRPVRRLTLAAENVAATQRLDPIEVHGSDEIGRLTSAFNAMLAALAASRDRQRALVADAGHELRTPLTSLRTNLDLLAQSDREGGLSAADRTELLGDVRAQVAELSDLVGDLVELAREDPPVATTERVDLAEIVARAVERVARRAPEVHFATSCEPFVLAGDAAALERAVTNLLDNAAKWSPPEGTVTTTLVEGVLQVRDQGPGIDPADLPYVFDRFYRSQEARALPGSGLGLAIVQNAVQRHGGTVVATAAEGGGTVMTVRLPASSGDLGALSDSSQH
ncbi:MAG: HAMP domain-containing sensor histidine kinase [Actinomycetes bacterium]